MDRWWSHLVLAEWGYGFSYLPQAVALCEGHRDFDPAGAVTLQPRIVRMHIGCRTAAEVHSKTGHVHIAYRVETTKGLPMRCAAGEIVGPSCQAISHDCWSSNPASTAVDPSYQNVYYVHDFVQTGLS